MATTFRNVSRRRFLKTAILGGTVTIVLAACSGSGAPAQPAQPTSGVSSGSSAAPTSASGASASGSQAAALPAATAAQSSANPISIQAWQPWANQKVQYWNVIAANYGKENPRYKIILTNGATTQKTLTAISAGQPPDIFLYDDSTYVGSWANTGAIKNITSWVEDNGFQKKLAPGALDLVRVGSAYFAVPYMTDGYMLLTNTEVFQQEGLEPPKTMDDIVAIDEKLTKKEGGKLTRVGYHPMYDRFFSAATVPLWADQMGGHWYDETNHKITADDAPNVAALEWEREFYVRNGTTAMENFVASVGKEGSPTDPVAEGLIMMFIAGEWRVDHGDASVSLATPNFKYTLSPIPIAKDHPELHDANWSTGTAASIPHNAKYGQDALDFVGWMLRLDNQLYMADNIVNLPATLEALGAGNKITNSYIRTFSEYLLKSNKAGNVHVWPGEPVSQEYMDAVVKEEEVAVGGKETSEQALKSVVTQIQPQLDAAFQKKA